MIFLPASAMTSPDLASIRSSVGLVPRSLSASNGSVQPSPSRVYGDRLVERREDLLAVHAERHQQRRHRDLAAAVDARMHDVLGVELDVEPGAAIRE